MNTGIQDAVNLGWKLALAVRDEAAPGLLDTYEAEGAIWLRASAHGAEKDYVLIRSPERGGLPTYEAADIAYLREKLERGFDRAIYVLGADHHGVRGWYEVAARMLGYDPARVEVPAAARRRRCRSAAATW